MELDQNRLENDLLGNKTVPNDAYYGVHTARALENFPITGTPISAYPDLVNALAMVKQAAAIANRRLGFLDTNKASAISLACEQIREGWLHNQFVVDVIQGGAGTSTNMNANEVIANLGLQILGHPKGQYKHLHPNEHVNMGQSTNDVYPTAIKLAMYAGTVKLREAMIHLEATFAMKAVEFKDILKMGRTQLQDAVPMTLGQEFSAFADTLKDDILRISAASELLLEINLGATAIGTGINAHPDYAKSVCESLREVSALQVTTAVNLIKATQDCSSFIEISGALKRSAINLSKICNDLRLLSSGPRAGLGEINLPPRQAGSSIMPGKVNPVMPEVVNQIAFEIIGNDLTVTLASEAGQLQLNAFEPVIAHSIFKSLQHLRQGCIALADHCIADINANEKQLRSYIERSIGIVTALNPYIGYRNASDVAAEAYSTGQSVLEIVIGRGYMSPNLLNRVLRPELLTQPFDFNEISDS